MSRISVEWIDEHRREIVTGSAIIIIFFLAVFWWYIFSTASTGPLQMSAISGVVFIDDDLDGLFSPDDEFGFPAVAIQLYDSSGLLTSEVTHRRRGNIHFQRIRPRAIRCPGDFAHRLGGDIRTGARGNCCSE